MNSQFTRMFSSTKKKSQSNTYLNLGLIICLFFSILDFLRPYDCYQNEKYFFMLMNLFIALVFIKLELK